MTIGSRPPTVEEAVEVLMRMRTREFRAGQLAWWRERFGDEFADIVRRKVEAKWKRK